MQCVILAGGLGTRIRSRSGGLPKALIEIHGKPFITYQLEWLARQNVRQVVLSVGYRGDLIEKAVGDGTAFGVMVAYAHEGERLRGTGGALRLIADLDLLAPGFFVLYGDSFLPIEFAPVWARSSNGTVPTMTVLRNASRWDRSNVVFHNGEIALYDKEVMDPAGAGMDHIDYGLSVMTRDVITSEFAQDETADLSRLLKRLSREGRLRGVEVFERFYEIGSPQGLDDFADYVMRSGLNA